MTSDGQAANPTPGERREDEVNQLEYILRELPEGAPVTRLLIGLNVAAFVVMIASGVHPLTPTSESLLAWGANFGPRTFAGEWWRMLTCTFIHSGAIHIAVNMYALWNGGEIVERMVGSASYLVLYVVAALFGSAVSLGVHPLFVSAGASGAIFGVYGALTGFLFRGHGDSPSRPTVRRLWVTVAVLLAGNLIGSLFIEGIDVAGHVGGLVAGFAGGLFLSRPLTAAALRGRTKRAAWLAAGGASAVVILLSVLPREVRAAEDQYALASFYERGVLMPGDDAMAAAWYRRAADQNFAPAQFELARLYVFGRGVTKDASEASRWFTRAAEAGYAEAQFVLGVRYSNGEGVAQNDVEAVRWYRRAADQEHAAAQYALGAMYANGRGVPSDDAEAIRWIRLAADQQYARAEYDLGNRYVTGRGVKQSDSEALRWYRRAADQHHPGAQYGLGTMYAAGRGVPKDEVEASRWYRLAAEQEHDAAQYALGMMYLEGRGVAKDEMEGIRWLRSAAEQGDARSQFELARALYEGRGVQRDQVEAVRWFRRAAEQNHPGAQVGVGVAYLNGAGVPRNPAEARVWFERAAKAGFAPASYYLAAMYARGEGIPVDNSTAMRLYRAAASQGYAPAQAELGLMYATGRSGTRDFVQAYVWLAVAETRADIGAGANRDKVAAMLRPEQLQDAKARVAVCLESKFQDCGEPVANSRPAGPASPRAGAGGTRGDRSSDTGP